MPLDKLPNKTYPGFCLSMLDRAIKEFFAIRCTNTDLEKLHTYFTRNGIIRCVYCNSPNPKRWDHVFPVSLGGDTVLGNLVPACIRCDDSKQDRGIDEWASSKSKYRPKQGHLATIRDFIRRYQSDFGYSPLEFEKKLSDEQKLIYKRLKQQIRKIRTLLQHNGITN